MPLTRYDQVIDTVKQFSRPVRSSEILAIVEREHRINRQNLSVILSTMTKRGMLESRVAEGESQIKVYSLPATNPSAQTTVKPSKPSKPTKPEQPKERGRAKLHRPAATPPPPTEPSPSPESQSVPHPDHPPMVQEVGRGPLFFDCSGGELDDIFGDDPVAQDIAEQIIRRMGDGNTLLTTGQLRPRECEAILFTQTLAKLHRAGIIHRAWLGDAYVGSYRYARPGCPLLADLPTTCPKHQAEPAPAALNQDPAPSALPSAGPVTEPVTPSAADSLQAPAPDPDPTKESDAGGGLNQPFDATSGVDAAADGIPLWQHIAQSVPAYAGLNGQDLRAAMNADYSTTTIRSRLLDLDDLIGELCTTQAPHTVIRAVHAASASLRHAAELLTAHRATTAPGATP